MPLRPISIQCFFVAQGDFLQSIFWLGMRTMIFQTTVFERAISKKVKVHPTFAIDQIGRHISSQSQCLKNTPKGRSGHKAQSNNKNCEPGGTVEQSIMNSNKQ